MEGFLLRIALILTILLILASCGKVKVEPKPVHVMTPTSYEVIHKIDISGSILQFKELCTIKHSSVVDEYEKEEKVGDCIQDNVQSLMDIIASYQKKE